MDHARFTWMSCTGRRGKLFALIHTLMSFGGLSLLVASIVDILVSQCTSSSDSCEAYDLKGTIALCCVHNP